MQWGPNFVEIKEIIRQITDREPLNPYQIAGMAAVIRNSGIRFGEGTTLEVDGLNNVLMVMDRTGEDASSYLIDVKQDDSRLVMFPKYPRESLEELVYITGFEGRRDAIRENLIPILYEIPHWLDVVRLISGTPWRGTTNPLPASLKCHGDRAQFPVCCGAPAF